LFFIYKKSTDDYMRRISTSIELLASQNFIVSITDVTYADKETIYECNLCI